MAHKLYVNPPRYYNFEEFCPRCEEQIAVVIDDRDFKHYTFTCPNCCEKMMLCTLCHWDYGADVCDWCESDGCILERAEKGLCPFPPRIE